MIKLKHACASLVVLAGLTPRLLAQAPAAPAAGAAATAAPASSGQTLWKFLGLSKDNIQACKDKYCTSQFGLLTSNFLNPVNALAGGLVPSCCPPVTAADLAKPPDSAEGAAARIKQDELAAKKRREAVRYLGTVPCNYWPEAQDALINALRADRNECVRLEAAIALGSGCCCNKATMKALTLTVNGSKEDGNPAECSERVKAAALAALQRCLACAPAEPAEPIKEKPREGEKPREELPPAKPGSAAPDLLPKLQSGELTTSAAAEPAQSPIAYYKRVQYAPMTQIVEQAQKAVAPAAPKSPPCVQARPAEGGLVGIIMGAGHTSSSTPEAGKEMSGRTVSGEAGTSTTFQSNPASSIYTAPALAKVVSILKNEPRQPMVTEFVPPPKTIIVESATAPSPVADWQSVSPSPVVGSAGLSGPQLTPASNGIIQAGYREQVPFIPPAMVGQDSLPVVQPRQEMNGVKPTHQEFSSQYLPPTEHVVTATSMTSQPAPSSSTYTNPALAKVVSIFKNEPQKQMVTEFVPPPKTVIVGSVNSAPPGTVWQSASPSSVPPPGTSWQSVSPSSMTGLAGISGPQLTPANNGIVQASYHEQVPLMPTPVVSQDSLPVKQPRQETNGLKPVHQESSSGPALQQDWNAMQQSRPGWSSVQQPRPDWKSVQPSASGAQTPVTGTLTPPKAESLPSRPVEPPATKPAASTPTGTLMPVKIESLPTRPPEPMATKPIATTAPTPASVIKVAPPVHVASAPAAVPAAPATGTSDIPRLVTLLSVSVKAEEREAAATGLANMDGRTNPQAIAVLVSKAQYDPSTAVRIACIRSLVRANDGSELVSGTLQDLRKDSEYRVRKEANEAVNRLRSTTTTISSDQPARPSRVVIFPH